MIVPSVHLLFRLLSCWPLGWLHALGRVVGWLAYLVSGTYRRRFEEHARLAGLSAAERRGAIGAAGEMALELPRLWMGKPVPIEWAGDDWIERALADGRGIVFLTPHLGSFDVTARGYAARWGAAHGPITVLYRPARKAWLRGLIDRGRQAPGLVALPTGIAGVRQMLRAVRSGGAVGLLPDQVPPAGLGVWAPFFGRPAYTMTLPARLAAQPRTTLLLAWGERLRGGRGYRIHVRPGPASLPESADDAARAINASMETLIREAPAQYLWGYARYKTPASSVEAVAAGESP